MIEQLLKELEKRVEVEAVLLGGSRATKTFDDKSDYDFYVYLSMPFAEADRRKLLEPYVSYMEYSNEFWELEDDGILNNGVEIEFIYRTVSGISESLENLVGKGNVSHGYTTCFLDNILKSKIIFDKSGAIRNLKIKYKDGVSNELAHKIVAANFPIIIDSMPALYKQVEKAVNRGDLHSINHRITAYFELYYDILFAINGETHPGEKRLLSLASKLPKLPENFVSLVESLFGNMFQDNIKFMLDLKALSRNLRELLKQEKYI